MKLPKNFGGNSLQQMMAQAQQAMARAKNLEVELKEERIDIETPARHPFRRHRVRWSRVHVFGLMFRRFWESMPSAIPVSLGEVKSVTQKPGDDRTNMLHR